VVLLKRLTSYLNAVRVLLRLDRQFHSSGAFRIGLLAGLDDLLGFSKSCGIDKHDDLFLRSRVEEITRHWLLNGERVTLPASKESMDYTCW